MRVLCAAEESDLQDYSEPNLYNDYKSFLRRLLKMHLHGARCLQFFCVRTGL